MAFATRSYVFAFSEETTEGTYLNPTAAQFTAIREGSILTGAVETTDSDEIVNSIGQSKSFVTKEAPTGSISKYLKTSGVVGQAPDYSVLIESAIGDVVANATEYSVTTGSTAGTATVRGTLAMASSQEANFSLGQALLIKDGTNNYAVRNAYYPIGSGVIPMSFNLANAPASGVGLGKAVFYAPQNTDHKTFTAHAYQASAATSALHQAISGCRTTSMTFDFPVNELSSVQFEIGGIKYFYNPLTVTSSLTYIDFTDDGGTVAAAITNKTYQTPEHLADEIASKMTAASVGSGNDTITCTWDNSTGKFTLASDGSTFSLLWNTGTNTANTIGTLIGFAVAADDTGATTYTADNALTYEPSVTPAYDSAEPQIVKDNMLLLGDFDDYLCFGGQALSIAISTPKTDVPNWCAENGVDESVTLSREVTISGTIKFSKHDVSRVYKLLKNETISLAFTTGTKTADNWVPGTITNVYCPECSITTEQVVDNDGYIVEEFEARAIVGTNMADIYVNQL